MYYFDYESKKPSERKNRFLSRGKGRRREGMKDTYWYAVNSSGTRHLFVYKPERDTGIWNGEEVLQISQGTLREVFPKITW